MAGLPNQVWVTSALCDKDVEKALIFCMSLRRTFSTRKIAVVSSGDISPKLRPALSRGFDFVFHLDKDLNTVGLKVEDYAKVYVLNALSGFQKCAYACPTMMALKNCDEVFAYSNDGLSLLEHCVYTPIFLIKPSMDDFDKLMTSFSKRNSGDLKPINCANNKTEITTVVPEIFCNAISKNTSLIGYEDEISMVNFLDYPNCSERPNYQHVGALEQRLTAWWQKIYQDDVLPIISSSTIPRMIGTTTKYSCDQANQPIAIVGMSCRFPGSNNLEEFWDLLVQGKDATSNPPSFRWRREQCSDHRENASKTNAGFLKVPVDEFDGKFFGISPKEAVGMDPQHRLLHELVWEGLEDACIDPQTLRGTSGSVFTGSWIYDYKEIVKRSGNFDFYREYMGNSIGAGAARISFLLEMTGPSIATESGCSSAMVAVDLACRALRQGQTGLALACGVNLVLNQFDETLMPVVISPDGHCKTFSEDANGFARAEGGGVLVLKRLSDAFANGDHIWGLVRGSAVSQEGISKSMGTPTVQCESLAMQGALCDAHILPEQVSYLETHGTGTVVGDPMEVAAITKAYMSPNRKEPLIIGSVKTNVGHTESCSGITGIMKTILAMHHELIPAHKNFTKLNPSIDLEAVPAVIPLEPIKWPRINGKSRFAGVSSFGITGTDAHVILEEPPQHPNCKALAFNEIMKRPSHILNISAKSEEAMEILLGKYKDFLSTSSSEAIADISFSANTGRATFPIRTSLIGKSKQEMIDQINNKSYLRGTANIETRRKVCFLFTGQGSQYPGMAKQLYESSPVFQMHFDYCDKILREMHHIQIKNVIWSVKPNEEAKRTMYSQASIFCVEYALLKLWESWGVKPDFVLGHSLGEFSAAVCAGVLTVEDAIKLVAERSKLIDELPRGKMLVVMAGEQQVVKLINDFAGGKENEMLEIAAVNSTNQTVIAGDTDLILKFSEHLSSTNIKCTMLEAAHAFHSGHNMEPMLEKYRNVGKTIKNLKPKCGYISGLKGDLIDSGSLNEEYWVQHTREKVQFLAGSRKAVQLGCTTFIEIGPEPVLCALIMMNIEPSDLMCLPSLRRNENEWTTLLNTLGKLHVTGLDIDWHRFDQFFNRRKVRLPHYPFIGKRFWPELLETGDGSIIHPLIGSRIPNASPIQLFQNGLNLKSLGYIRDHLIGPRVIFPGAGYLEMCLAAGLASMGISLDSFAHLGRSMKVENLKIKVPMALQEDKPCQVQTVVDLKNANVGSIKVEIFHRLESGLEEKWVSHGSATFSPAASTEEQIVPFDKKQFHATLSEAPDSSEIAELYEKLSAVGLNFGSTFKSLEKVWRYENGSLLAKVKYPMESNSQSGSYIIHPVIMDAMIQAMIVPKLTRWLKNTLYIPIKVGKLVWLSKGVDEFRERFVHVNNTGDETTAATLLDSNGSILASMTNVSFAETTLKTVEAVLEQQTFTMPDMWEETWHPRLGPQQDRIDLTNVDDKFYDQEFYNNIVETCDNLSPDLQLTFAQLERLSYCYMLRSLYECGFQPVVGTTLQETHLFKELKISDKLWKYGSYMLSVLEDENLLEKIGAESWKILRLPPSLEHVDTELSSPTLNTDLINSFKPAQLLINLGENLRSVLQGEKSALRILFPEGEENEDVSSVAKFYANYYKKFATAKMISAVLKPSLHHLLNTHSSMKPPILRVCEVGAGTGAFSEYFLESLSSLNVDFEYTYTDISAAFFPAAEKRFEKYLGKLIFKKLNIEDDPIEQGFVPEYYDIIFAADVIHATKNLRETLTNIVTILRLGGQFDMLETTKENRYITYLFGVLDGFWRFEDFHMRPNHCSLSNEGWQNVLEESGFDMIETFPSLNQNHSFILSRRKMEMLEEPANPASQNKAGRYWIVFHHEGSPMSQFIVHKIPQVANRNVIRVIQGSTFERDQKQGVIEFQVRKHSEEDFVAVMKCIENMKGVSLEGIAYCWSLEGTYSGKQEDILQPFFYLSKAILSLEETNGLKIAVLTAGVLPVEETDLTHFQYSTLPGFLKSLQNEQTGLNCRLVDMGDNERNSGFLQTFQELWYAEREPQVAYQGCNRYVPKLLGLKPSLSDLTLSPCTDRYQLVLPDSRSISDLQFGHLEMSDLQPGQIEIQVKASALNFRDVFSVLKPTEAFRGLNTVGSDFAGTVQRVHATVAKWRVGDHVFGITVNGAALPSHKILDESDVVAIPTDMTFSEACTLPAVFATSYHSLIDVAKIKPNDVVLIHTASGGVGLIAIQICKYVGATVIATAGNKRKRNYLRSQGIQHIFNSRNTDYSRQILDVTNDRGVDVVLNSLTSKGFKEATLLACAKGARFIEMSKLSVWTPEEVRTLRPDVLYRIVDVSSKTSYEWHGFMENLTMFMMNKKVVNPIPHVSFSSLNIRDALQYMQKAKHIGKIVCKMPELRYVDGKLQVYTSMFHSNATYLITGGMGGIGFEVCKWMVKMGAKYVLLAGRSRPSQKFKHQIAQINGECGSMVTVVQLDVSNFDQCRELFDKKIPEIGYPEIRGVMHAAGTLHDGLIINQSWDTLSSTFRTKVEGTLNLHEMTKHNSKLEHFVLFSSLASIAGARGQSNHSAGNFFEDTFAHYRYSLGLPATSINWGQWGEVGVATELDLPGLKPLTNHHGINGLEYVMKSQRVQTGIFNIESFVLLTHLYPHLSVYVDERLWKAAAISSSVDELQDLSQDEFWQEYDKKQDLTEKQDLLKEKVRLMLAKRLKIEDIVEVKDNSDLQEIGLDSLMFLEFKNDVQSLVGDRAKIHERHLRYSKNVQDLSQVLFNLIEGLDMGQLTEAPTVEQVAQLIDQDCILPGHITPRADQQRIRTEEISTVFLTGVTGTLGPYLLRELSNRSQVKQIICLIRTRRNFSEDERLREILKDRHLLQEIDESKVRCVSGNVALPRLGMEKEIWNELVDSVDAVFNCAALIQYVEFYLEESSQNSMRAVNVGGLKNLLEFCVIGQKLKHIFNASSVLGGLSVDENGNWSENWPEPKDFDGITTLGYPVSKFVGDVIMKEAVTNRKIPGKVFRYPLISGDSKTGRFVLEQNHFMLRFVFSLMAEIISSKRYPLPIFPVDICAYVSVEICFNPGAQDCIYNIINLKPDIEQEFISIGKRFGRDIRTVDPEQFAEKVMKETSGPLSIFKDFEVHYMSLVAMAPVMQKWLRDGSTKEDFFESKNVLSVIPGFYESSYGLTSSMEFVYKDLLFAKEQGWLERFGL